MSGKHNKEMDDDHVVQSFKSIGDIFCTLLRVQRVEDLPEEVRKFAELEQVVKDINTMDMSSEDKRKRFKTKVQSVLELWEEKDQNNLIISTKLWALL